MSIATAQKFAQAYADDEALRARLKNAATPAEKNQIMADAGFGDVSKEDMEALHRGEMSEEDMAPVAGAGGLGSDPRTWSFPDESVRWDDFMTDCGWGG